MRVFSSFPFSQPRKYQREVINHIEDAFAKVRFVLLEAPTGSGKSVIAATFARHYHSAHIITVTKALQDQYKLSFSDFGCQKGKGAYTCREDKTTCAEGICNRVAPARKKELLYNCTYRRTLEENVGKDVVVHNFDSFYYQHILGGKFSKKELLVVDEAHNIESKMVSMHSFKIPSQGFLRENPKRIFPVYRELSEYITIVKEERERMYESMISLGRNQDEIDRETYNLIERIARIVYKIDVFLRDYENNEYVFDVVDEKQGNSILFRPVFGQRYVRSSLFAGFPRVLLMSATILNKSLFCRSIGISSNSMCYIQVPSTFPVENRPVYLKYAGLMTFKKINETLPKMVSVIERLLEKHKCRGIIHTGSERIARYIRDNMKNPRLTFYKDFTSLESMLEVHRRKAQSIIVASGLKEGVDLYGDLSRLQIICKVPYLDLGDKRTKRRMEVDPTWYGYATTMLLVQSFGRSVRSQTDTAVTYMLDSAFLSFYQRNKRFVPYYVRHALRGG